MTKSKIDDLLELITTYGTEKDTHEFWNRLARRYSPDEIVHGISSTLRNNDDDAIWCACVFTQHAAEGGGHFGPVIRESVVINQIEDIAAGDNLRNAHTAVFVLGRIGSKKSAKKLRQILVASKHKDSEFVRNLEVNIRMLEQ